jgi:hypothetical protein
VKELFPNWDKQVPAAFTSLRTTGAFLVDAACAGGTVEYVKVRSEKGGCWKMVNPWNAAIDLRGNVHRDSLITVDMNPGEEITLKEYI